HRKLSDYCNIFAEKTNRIGRNVENFMQSRGFFATRRSADEASRCNLASLRSNGNVIRTDYRRYTNEMDEPTETRAEDQRRYGRNRRDRPVYPADVYPRGRNTVANYVARDMELQPRRVRQRDYLYEANSSWREALNDWNGSKPILRNGVSHGRGGERLYSSTLPRRSRTINFRDQYSLESRRGYPKSLQDLSDLELDERIREQSLTASFLSSNSRDWREHRLSNDGYRRRRYREDQLEHDYLRLYRSLSRLNKYPQGGKYEPGQVHYERECRTFGKDTVAFIYYKTCYL
ncbi:hypothetical protein WH47_00336, partial [Habropoda laboriosa]